MSMLVQLAYWSAALAVMAAVVSWSIPLPGILRIHLRGKIKQWFTSYYYNFNLIELMVVMAIIGILLTILVPALSKAKENGRRAVCANNLKQCYHVASMYADDFGSLPRVHNTLNADGTPCYDYTPGDMHRFNYSQSASWGQMVVNYSGDAWRIFYCPNLEKFHPKKPQYFTNANCDAIGYIPWQWASGNGRNIYSFETGLATGLPFMGDITINWGVHSYTTESPTTSSYILRVNGHGPGYKKEGSNAIYYDGSCRWYNWSQLVPHYGAGWWMRPPNP